MSVGINDVAKAAKVSTATVSRALRGLPGVGERTRDYVIATARELGYVPSHNASALASGKTGTVGIVMPNVSHWFFSTILESAEQTLRASNMDALVYFLPYTSVPNSQFDPNALRGKVDAILVTSMFFTDEEIHQLDSLQVPVAFLSVEQPGFPHVGIDDEQAAVTACDHLLSLGHTAIAHISDISADKNPATPTQRRYNGWRSALEAAGLPYRTDLDIRTAEMTPQDGYTATTTLLDNSPDVTAIFASSDELAMGCMQAIRERDLTPGREISVVGVDGHMLSEAFGLSTVSQPAREEGARAARILIEAMQGLSGTQRVIYPTTLIQRSSTGPVSDR